MSYKAVGMIQMPCLILKGADFEELFSVVSASGVQHPRIVFGVYEGYLSPSGVFICKLLQETVG